MSSHLKCYPKGVTFQGNLTVVAADDVAREGCTLAAHREFIAQVEPLDAGLRGLPETFEPVAEVEKLPMF